ncbi:hypothetical protein ACF5W4_06935 [Bacillota bacterium Lsc_1132]
MSLKSIEMQIALPRSIDASKLQDQLSHRGQQLQDHAVQAGQQQEVKQRSTVLKNDESHKSALRDGDQSQDHGGQNKKNRKNDSQQTMQQNGTHPYKGNFLDFSG